MRYGSCTEQAAQVAVQLHRSALATAAIVLLNDHPFNKVTEDRTGRSTVICGEMGVQLGDSLLIQDFTVARQVWWFGCRHSRERGD